MMPAVHSERSPWLLVSDECSVQGTVEGAGVGLRSDQGRGNRRRGERRVSSGWSRGWSGGEGGGRADERLDEWDG